MYCLKQAARLARDQPIKTLAPFGYHPCKHAPNLWTHTSRPTKFCLCVDDFGIKHYTEDDLTHLLSALQSAYETAVDCSGSKFCGLNLNWNYNDGHVDISMPKYVISALENLTTHHQENHKMHHILGYP